MGQELRILMKKVNINHPIYKKFLEEKLKHIEESAKENEKIIVTKDIEEFQKEEEKAAFELWKVFFHFLKFLNFFRKTKLIKKKFLTKKMKKYKKKFLNYNKFKWKEKRRN